MGKLSQEEINVDLFDEVKRLEKENKELKAALNEVNQCIDSFYTKEEPRRLYDVPLSRFSGQIQVIDKVSDLKD